MGVENTPLELEVDQVRALATGTGQLPQLLCTFDDDAGGYVVLDTTARTDCDRLVFQAAADLAGAGVTAVLTVDQCWAGDPGVSPSLERITVTGPRLNVVVCQGAAVVDTGRDTGFTTAVFAADLVSVLAAAVAAASRLARTEDAFAAACGSGYSEWTERWDTAP